MNPLHISNSLRETDGCNLQAVSGEQGVSADTARSGMPVAGRGQRLKLNLRYVMGSEYNVTN